jgi:flagellar hook-length control protein FliK
LAPPAPGHIAMVAAKAESDQEAVGRNASQRRSAIAIGAIAADARPDSSSAAVEAAHDTQAAAGNVGFAAAPVAVDQLADAIAGQASSMGAPRDAAGASPNAAASSPVKELDIQLNPGELGALNVKMRLAGGALVVVIEVAKPSTLKLIEGERDAISDRLTSTNQTASVEIKSASNAQTHIGNGNATSPDSGARGNAREYSDRPARTSQDAGSQTSAPALPHSEAPLDRRASGDRFL